MNIFSFYNDYLLSLNCQDFILPFPIYQDFGIIPDTYFDLTAINIFVKCTLHKNFYLLQGETKMKKFSKLAVILTALAVSLMLTACPHSNEGGSTQAATYLDGTYKMKTGSQGQHYLFLPDGTIEINTGFHGANEGSGTYTISGNTLSGNGNIGEDTETITGRKDSDGKWFVTYTVSFANGNPDFTSEEHELIKQ